MSEKNALFSSVSEWFRRTFSDPAAVVLFLTLVFGLIFLELFGKILMPVLVSVVIAYLLAAIVRLLEKFKLPHLLAVIVVYLLFIGVVAYLFMVLMPLLVKQLSNLIEQLPKTFAMGQTWADHLIKRYPALFSQEEMQRFTLYFKDQTIKVGQYALQYSLATIPSVIEIILYVILVPLLVFFFLKDSRPITEWFVKYLPNDRGLVSHVWTEVNEKIGLYVRGRVAEVFIIGMLSVVVFALLKLQYAILLGALVGLSVIIPYIGAIVVTIPVVIVALMQWGMTAHFFYLVGAYAAIIAFDANLLVPLLFAGTMNLHPVVIILSVVIFGAIWGFWGVFFAIPLATLIDVVLRSWPRGEVGESA